MEKMLDDLAHGFSENSAELFDSVYADFEKNATVSDAEQERILSSVMRKAGFEMKDNISAKRARKSKKRIVTVFIAAAIVLVGTSFTAMRYFKNEESVYKNAVDEEDDGFASVVKLGDEDENYFDDWDSPLDFYYVNDFGVGVTKEQYINLLNVYEPNAIAAMPRSGIDDCKDADHTDRSHYADDDIIYTNRNGAALTKRQYINLMKAFDPNEIISLPYDIVEMYKDDDSLECSYEDIYIRTDIVYDENGEVISADDTEVSVGEFNDSPSGKAIIQEMANSSVGTVCETNYKRVEIKVSHGASTNVKNVSLTCIWKQIPRCKSFDVLAVSAGEGSTTLQNDLNRYGYQLWDGNRIDYAHDSQNWKEIKENETWKSGIGLSQNIKDEVTHSLTNYMFVQFESDSDQFTVAGSYYHAHSDVEPGKSQNFSFPSGGIVFSSSF